MSELGHNSAIFGEDDIDAADESNKLFFYVQWNLADYISGTRNMTPEQEGIYIRFLTRLYDRGKAFLDDDRKMALEMVLDVRKWRRIRSELLATGKILARDGCLTNSRFEKERKKRAADLRKQAAATRKYWEDRREKKRTSGELRADFAPTSAELRAEVSPKSDEKVNEINDSKQYPTRDTRKSRVQNKKEDSVPDGTGAEAPPPEKALREMIWDEGIAWLRPRACMSEAKLRGQVGRWAKDHDPGFVLNAIAVAQKENPVSVMPYIEGVLRRGPTMTVNGKRLAPWEAEALERERREDAALEELREYEKTLNRERV